MAALKSLISVSVRSQAAVLVLFIAVSALTHLGESQSCPSQLNTLNVCAPFVVPGAHGNPSTECCNALQSVQNDCLCNTLAIAARLPSLCHLPSLNCVNN
ncbi:stamen-specific protein FIL1 [Hevea brasiliensis]|nr:stamen-specific protein FIL1 [Hevea brasiliensis]